MTRSGRRSCDGRPRKMCLTAQKRQDLWEPSLCRCAVVSVMQAVDLRTLDDASGGGWRDGA